MTSRAGHLCFQDCKWWLPTSDLDVEVQFQYFWTEHNADDIHFRILGSAKPFVNILSWVNLASSYGSWQVNLWWISIHQHPKIALWNAYSQLKVEYSLMNDDEIPSNVHTELLSSFIHEWNPRGWWWGEGVSSLIPGQTHAQTKVCPIPHLRQIVAKRQRTPNRLLTHMHTRTHTHTHTHTRPHTSTQTLHTSVHTYAHPHMPWSP